MENNTNINSQVSLIQKGSTLIEVLIALVLLSLLVVGLNSGIISLISSNFNSKNLTTATIVGNSQLEKLRLLNYYDITTDLDTARNYFILDWKVNESDMSKKIDLTVLWPKETQIHSIKLSTIIAEH